MFLMADADRRIRAVATGQMGAFSRSQANEAGLTDHQLRSRVQSGFLERVGPNAFRMPGTDNTELARLSALMIDVGEPCWAAGPTAAALHRLDGFELAPPFHLVTPRDRQVRRTGSVIHTSEFIPVFDCCEIDGIRTIRATRTLIDLARICDRTVLTIALDSAVRDRLTSETAVHRRLARIRGRGRFGVIPLLEVIEGNEIIRGGHSFLEREFLRLVSGGGLPRPATQAVLTRAGDRLVRVDFRFPETRVVVEVLGYRFHRTRAQLSRDVERLNALIADGYRPYQFTYDQVMHGSKAVLDQVSAALHQQAA
jgi:hypothetical protein